MIGHDKVGSGPLGVIVLNDWLCDTSTWDGARAYLDEDRFTWTFADLRGYGRSMGRHGELTVTEAAADVVGLADALGWRRFAIVGHSMSSLVAHHLGQHLPDRIERAVVSRSWNAFWQEIRKVLTVNHEPSAHEPSALPARLRCTSAARRDLRTGRSTAPAPIAG